VPRQINRFVLSQSLVKELKRLIDAKQHETLQTWIYGRQLFSVNAALVEFISATQHREDFSVFWELEIHDLV